MAVEDIVVLLSRDIMDVLYDSESVTLDSLVQALNIRVEQHVVFDEMETKVKLNKSKLKEYLAELEKKGVVSHDTASNSWSLTAVARDSLKSFKDVLAQFSEAEAILVKDLTEE